MSENDLHKLLWENPTVEEVRALIDKYPDAVKNKSNNGNGHLPLHIAVRYGGPVEEIQLFIKAYPDAVREKNELGDLLLHYAIRYGASVEVIQLIIEAYPNAVREKNELGELPLHIAVRYGGPVEVIQLLIEAYPDAVRKKNEYGDLPLHSAVKNRPTEIQLPTDVYPDAFYKGASVEVLKLLIEEYPDALKEKNYGGELPLHVAAKKGASVEVIQLLIKAYPDAVREEDRSENLPLHTAIAGEASVEVLQLLIKEYPDAAKIENRDGFLPIDRPQIKEIYDSVKTLVQNLTRSQGLRGDHAEGEDLLGVKEEAQAIADTIAFKDLQPPFVVGILGGWGSGNSFTFNVIEEH